MLQNLHMLYVMPLQQHRGVLHFGQQLIFVHSPLKITHRNNVMVVALQHPPSSLTPFTHDLQIPNMHKHGQVHNSITLHRFK